LDDAPTRLAATANRHPDPDAPVVLLLHGLTEAGNSFGARFDDLPGLVVVPDLAGFGRSLSAAERHSGHQCDYRRDEHVRGLLDLCRHPALWGRRILIVGHSLGGVLALHLANALVAGRRDEPALPAPIGVVAMSTGLYESREEGAARIRKATPVMSRLMAGGAARFLCQHVCRRRGLGPAAWTVLGLRWPGAVARGGAEHSWRSFRQTLETVLFDTDHRALLAGLDQAGVPVLLVRGSRDLMQVPGRSEALAAEWPGVTSDVIPDGPHAPHLTHPSQCVRHIEDRLRTWA
jgi:pimeloyl-ACP methyl ester carboxylesterase